MKPPATRTSKIGHHKGLHAIIFTIAMLSFALNSANARTASVKPSDYRVLTAGDKFDNTWQVAVAFKLRPPRRLRARYLELALGSISTSAANHAFVSLGPVWRFPVNSRSLFVELGFSPTLTSGSTFNGRDLGGNLHFTSSAAVGATFGQFEAVSVSLRIQHTSNGGLNDTNPGLDMIGLNFALDFDKR